MHTPHQMQTPPYKGVVGISNIQSMRSSQEIALQVGQQYSQSNQQAQLLQRLQAEHNAKFSESLMQNFQYREQEKEEICPIFDNYDL